VKAWLRDNKNRKKIVTLLDGEDNEELRMEIFKSLVASDSDDKIISMYLHTVFQRIGTKDISDGPIGQVLKENRSIIETALQ